MENGFLHIIPTAFDLLALFICIGALVCHLYVIPTVGEVSDPSVPEILRTRLWHLTGAAVAMLTISSISELFMRTMEMSGRPPAEVFSMMPVVILRTHYGNLWVVRLIMILVLWIGWWTGRRRLDSRVISVFMVCAGVVIAITRSASGHAADMGDITLPELMDCLHLLAGSIWGGGLIVLSTLVLPILIKQSDRGSAVAYMAQRFSTIAGITLGIIAITATYNAWLEVGRLHALWETTYGQLIMVKVILLLILVVLGASNRYISVPLLQRLAGHSLPDQEALHLNPFQRKLELVRAARRFMQKVWAESVIVILVLICTALLLHQMPSRHISHAGHGHNMKKSKIIEEKRAYDGLCLTRCAAWEKGVR